MNQRITRMMLAATLIACSSLAQAQWIWVNEKGVKQLTDQPPPPGTPSNRILKAPRGQMPDLRKELDAGTAEPSPAAEAKAAPAKPTLAERNADFNKRRQEAEKKAAKDAEEAQQAADKARYCADAKQNIALLESGARVKEIAPSGDESIMTDDARSKRIQESRSSYNRACK